MVNGKVERTSAGLRDALFDELDSIRSGESNATRANAVAKLAGSVVDTVRMEIEVQKHARHVVSKVDEASPNTMGEPIKLGVNV